MKFKSLLLLLSLFFTITFSKPNKLLVEVEDDTDENIEPEIDDSTTMNRQGPPTGFEKRREELREEARRRWRDTLAHGH